MELEKYIIFLTFVPWILIVIVSMLNNLHNEHYKHFSLKYLGKNIFKIFRLDTLLLLVFFWYFSSFDREFVDQYLFAIMCLYMFVNFFYEKRNSLKKGFFRENILELLLLTTFSIIPFIYYYQTGELINTYKIMLLYLFFEYFIIIIISMLARIIRKLLLKKRSS